MLFCFLKYYCLPWCTEIKEIRVCVCVCELHHYSPTLKKWGLYWICDICPSFCDSVILSFRNLSVEYFSSYFSQELWGLEGWNLVHIWTVGRCMVYTWIRLLLILPFISSFFFLSSFQTLKIFVTLFSETVRPIKLTLDTHVDNGWMYHVYRNQAAAHICPFIFFHFSLSPIVKH